MAPDIGNILAQKHALRTEFNMEADPESKDRGYAPDAENRMT